MNVVHFALSRDANKSISGWPKYFIMSWNASSESDHSVSGLTTLDAASARFSLEFTYDRYMTYRLRCSQHFQRDLAKSFKWGYWIPPYDLHNWSQWCCPCAVILFILFIYWLHHWRRISNLERLPSALSNWYDNNFLKTSICHVLERCCKQNPSLTSTRRYRFRCQNLAVA